MGNTTQTLKTAHPCNDMAELRLYHETLDNLTQKANTLLNNPRYQLTIKWRKTKWTHK